MKPMFNLFPVIPSDSTKPVFAPKGGDIFL